jgi:hypothetical protein
MERDEGLGELRVPHGLEQCPQDRALVGLRPHGRDAGAMTERFRKGKFVESIEEGAHRRHG